MWGYWLGLIIGLFGAQAAGLLYSGKATSVASLLALLLVIAMFTGLDISLFLCGGPESWRDKIRQAHWPQVGLIFAGTIAGATPIMVGIVLVTQWNSLYAIVWAICALALGLPVMSWTTLFILARLSQNVDNETRQAHQQTDDLSQP